MNRGRGETICQKLTNKQDDEQRERNMIMSDKDLHSTRMAEKGDSGWDIARGCLLFFLIMPGAIILSIPLILLEGWALCLMWEWFIQPTIPVGPLTFGNAIGISLIVSLLTSHLQKTKTESSQKKETSMDKVVGLLTVLVGQGAGTLIILGMAYIVHVVWR